MLKIKNKVALIFGITGQDGSYLAELLLGKGYVVHGVVRRCSVSNTSRIDHLIKNSYVTDCKFHILYGDITDSICVQNIISKIKPDEIYNLAAQSHVGISFDIPEYTSNVDGLGPLRILEAIRNCQLVDKCKFYQASTSELYGKIVEIPQTEKTPFYPRSPYGCAKLYGYWITVNYREAYNIFAVNGILFNHETLAGFMPLIYKKNDIIDIKPISEIVKYETLYNGIMIDENKKIYQEGIVETDLYIWDNNDWTKVKFASGYPHDVLNNNKKPKFLVSKNSCYFVTGEHKIIMENNSEKECQYIKLGDKLKLINFPNEKSNINYSFKKKTQNKLECEYCNKILSRIDHFRNHIKKCKIKNKFLLNEINGQESELLGLFVGGGKMTRIIMKQSEHSDKKLCFSETQSVLEPSEARLAKPMHGNVSKSHIRFTNKDKKLVDYVIDLWINICQNNNKKGKYNINMYSSGFNNNVEMYHVNLCGFPGFFRKYIIYNEDKTKRVPYHILNSNKYIQEKFLEGYNKADGLKKNKCIYQFKNFKTNSATLAQGLIYLIKNTTDQDFNINVEYVKKNNINRLYYSINLSSNSKYSLKNSDQKYEKVETLLQQNLSQREINKITSISKNFIGKIQNNEYQSNKKHHLSKCSNQIKKMIELFNYDGWFYDLETESGTFHAGIGLGRIHNSPRRGKNFVTRKITRAVCRIKLGIQECLYLGNLDSKRDWGHAKDYVYGIWLILQQEKPDDFILATGETHSVRDFCEYAFKELDIDIEWRGKRGSIEEVGIIKKTGKTIIRIDPKYFRPIEVDILLGCPKKAEETLGWKRKYDCKKLVEEMVREDLIDIKKNIEIEKKLFQI